MATDTTAEIRTVGDIARVHARHQPEALALAYGARRTTWAELDRDTNRVANGLLGLGLPRQSRIALIDKNTDDFHLAWIGAAKAGMALNAINWRLAAPEIAYILADSEPEVLLIGAEFLPLLADLGPVMARIRLVLVLGGPDGSPAPLAAFRPWLAAYADHDPAVAVSATDMAILLYTSGTTGHPKGAQLSHGNIMARAAHIGSGGLGPWGAAEIYLLCLPHFHVGGAGTGISALHFGASLLILREFSPDPVLQAFSTWRITKAMFVPAMLLMLLDHPTCAETDFGCLDTLYYGAAPIPLELLKRALATFGCDFIQLYGMTETTGTVLSLMAADHDPEGSPRMRSAGRPLPGVDLRIINLDGRAAATGEIGEILLRGDAIMTGYWRNPAATAAAIVDGWLHTGDAGFVDADGYLYIHDRLKDMIISGGENVYPAEVENALFGHAAIADVAVIGVPDDTWGEAVKAVVVLKPGAVASAEDIIRHARASIAGYKCPKSVDFVASLPRNASGKLLKRELRLPYWSGHSRQVN